MDFLVVVLQTLEQRIKLRRVLIQYFNIEYFRIGLMQIDWLSQTEHRLARLQAKCESGKRNFSNRESLL